jgi:hypothetical protein
MYDDYGNGVKRIFFYLANGYVIVPHAPAEHVAWLQQAQNAASVAPEAPTAVVVQPPAAREWDP